VSPELGMIEGFYGKPWTWEEREENVAWLARHGYRFYLYAPKADPFLRQTRSCRLSSDADSYSVVNAAAILGRSDS
jgi:hypothetical protein